jgi:hypothetical protein
MKKILIFSLFVISLFAFPTETEYKIVSSSDKFANINENVVLGSSGIVVQNGVIIALVEAIENKKLKYLPFSNLKNRALASPKLTPKKGDTIKMYHNYDKSLIIAPTQTNYLNIKSKLKEVINSDLLVTMSNDIEKLTQKDFQNFCKEYSIGVIYFNLDKDYVVDCNTFKVIETATNTLETKYEKPLFSSYKLNKTDTNYIEYYKNLIKVK